MKQHVRGLPRNQGDLIDLARQQDWNVTKTGTGHIRLVSPRGQIVIASSTPSDKNSVMDLRARLKRYGLKPGKIKPQKAPLPEPKLVVDRSVVEEKVVEEKVNVPAEPTVPAKRTPTGARGRIREALVEILQQHDREKGHSAIDLIPLVKEKLGIEIDSHTIGQSLLYYTKTDHLFTKVAYGSYRLTKMLDTPTAPTAPKEPEQEDDEKVLIEFLVMLDKVGNIVKRHIELNKELTGLLKKLGGNK